MVESLNNKAPFYLSPFKVLKTTPLGFFVFSLRDGCTTPQHHEEFPRCSEPPALQTLGFLAGGNSNIFLIFTPKIGEMIQFDEHFCSNGLVQPPPRFELTVYIKIVLIPIPSMELFLTYMDG